jgi:hypothetical protein
VFSTPCPYTRDRDDHAIDARWPVAQESQRWIGEDLETLLGVAFDKWCEYKLVGVNVAVLIWDIERISGNGQESTSDCGLLIAEQAQR